MQSGGSSITYGSTESTVPTELCLCGSGPECPQCLCAAAPLPGVPEWNPQLGKPLSAAMAGGGYWGCKRMIAP